MKKKQSKLSFKGFHFRTFGVRLENSNDLFYISRMSEEINKASRELISKYLYLSLSKLIFSIHTDKRKSVQRR